MPKRKNITHKHLLTQFDDHTSISGGLFAQDRRFLYFVHAIIVKYIVMTRGTILYTLIIVLS